MTKEIEKAKKPAPMNKKVFYSKKNIVLGLIMWGGLFLALMTMSRTGHWIGIAIMLPIMVFVGSMWFGTKYTLVDNRELKIQSGFIHFETVEVLKIIEIKKTGSWLSAPANSLDRIEIFYNKYGGSVVISPPDKKAFVKILLAINPKIKTEIA